MKTRGVRLTQRQKVFISKYEKYLNASRAAAAAGYSKKTAGQVGYQLLQIPSIQTALARSMDERLKKAGIEKERVLKELARVGLSDLRKLYKEDGKLKHPNEWDDDVAAAIAGVEVTEEFEGHGKECELIGHTKKVRVFDKVRALETLGKYLNLITDRVQLSGPDGGPVPVKLYDFDPSKFPVSEE